MKTSKRLLGGAFLFHSAPSVCNVFLSRGRRLYSSFGGVSVGVQQKMSIWKTTSEDKKTWNKGENPKNMQRKTRILKTVRGRRGDGEESFIVKKGVYIIMFYRLDCPWLPHAKFPAGWVGELLLLVKSKVKGKTREESRAAPVLPAIQARGEILQLDFQLKGFNIFIGKQFNIIHDKTRMGIGQTGPTWRGNPRSYLEVQILILLSPLESLQGRRRVVSIKYYKKREAIDKMTQERGRPLLRDDEEVLFDLVDNIADLTMEHIKRHLSIRWSC